MDPGGRSLAALLIFLGVIMPRIRLSEQSMRDLKGEADRTGRSVDDQLAHWVRLGRMIERSGLYSHIALTDLLAGDLKGDSEAPPSDQGDGASSTP
jgi:hypothetical protein